VIEVLNDEHAWVKDPRWEREQVPTFKPQMCVCVCVCARAGCVRALWVGATSFGLCQLSEHGVAAARAKSWFLKFARLTIAA
jgi:hypothetical protein